MSTTRTRWAVATTTGLIAASAAVVLTGLPASADVTVNNLTVSDDSHYVGATYQVSSKGRVGAIFEFVVVHNNIPEYRHITIGDGQTAASFTWTPADTGTYTFSADVQDGFYTGTVGPLDVTVSAAPPTTTTVPPTTTTPAPPTTTTTPPTTTTTPVAEWHQNATYKVGDVVTYDGVQYRCIQAHTAYAPNWTPPLTPALWQRL